MTPQEQELVDNLFDRLAKLENNPRDPDAERLIVDGMRQAPHATYALVQTALVLDEALKHANARIEELQAQLGGGEEQPQQGGFLDNMREAVFGRRDPRGSVPNVRAQAAQPPSAAPPAYQSPPAYPPGVPSYPTNPAFGPSGPGFGGGGSFLGAAASTAAGVIGGSLLLDSIRSMFGHHAGLGDRERSAFGSSGDQATPWSGSGSAADSDLARAAGIDSIGHGGVAEKDRDQADTASSDKPDDWNVPDDDGDFADDDGGDFGGDDSDYA